MIHALEIAYALEETATYRGRIEGPIPKPVPLGKIPETMPTGETGLYAYEVNRNRDSFETIIAALQAGIQRAVLYDNYELLRIKTAKGKKIIDVEPPTAPPLQIQMEETIISKFEEIETRIKEVQAAKSLTQKQKEAFLLPLQAYKTRLKKYAPDMKTRVRRADELRNIIFSSELHSKKKQLLPTSTINDARRELIEVLKTQMKFNEPEGETEANETFKKAKQTAQELIASIDRLTQIFEAPMRVNEPKKSAYGETAPNEEFEAVQNLATLYNERADLQTIFADRAKFILKTSAPEQTKEFVPIRNVPGGYELLPKTEAVVQQQQGDGEELSYTNYEIEKLEAEMQELEELEKNERRSASSIT
tara:strand:- start:254 stop:1342 length:1089 start_codon:yes stop_codon:yes gene_type:complete